MFKHFWKHINEALNNVRTCIVKNILFFLKEVFMNAKTHQVHDDIIKGVIPRVMLKSLKAKKFIKGAAHEILTHFANNCLQDASVYLTCKLCFDKNPQIQEKSLRLLCKIIQHTGKNIIKF